MIHVKDNLDGGYSHIYNLQSPPSLLLGPPTSNHSTDVSLSQSNFPPVALSLQISRFPSGV